MNQNFTASVRALSEYNRINVQTGIESASPQRLIKMLMEGALAKISSAKSALSQKKMDKKGEDVGNAISIIGGLRDSLDLSSGYDIASNLDSLYEYMTYRLLEANMKNDKNMMDEVHQLLSEIKSGWDAINETDKSNIADLNKDESLQRKTG